MIRLNFQESMPKIARVAFIIIFLALIRTISECFRLQYYSSTQLTFDQFKLFLIGALITSIALLGMTISLFYKKYIIIISISILSIIILLVLKSEF